MIQTQSTNPKDDELAVEYGLEFGDVAIQASLRELFVDCTLIGMSRPERPLDDFGCCIAKYPRRFLDSRRRIARRPAHCLDADN